MRCSDYSSISFKDNDYLDRKLSYDIILELIDNYKEDGAISIAVNAKWGTGKTYFIKLCKNEINCIKGSNDVTIYYNAWDFDDSEDALLPILHTVLESITDETNTEYEERIKIFLKAAFVASIKTGIVKLFGKDTPLEKVISEGFDKASSDKIKDAYRDYENYYKNRGSLTEAISSLVPKEGKLWIFIDDLDRCKPDFAINTLECIKHFFDINRVIFIFSVDIAELSKTIGKVYGDNNNRESYLLKFFDYVYPLPRPNIQKYVDCLVKEKGINSIELDRIKEINTRLYTNFNHSLREINQNIQSLEFFLENHQQHIRNIVNDKQTLDITLLVYLYFLVIKDKFSIDYFDIIYSNFSDMEDKSRQLKYTGVIDTIIASLYSSKEPILLKSIPCQACFFPVCNNNVSFAEHLEGVFSYRLPKSDTEAV